MSLRCVEHVRDPDAPEVVHILDGVAVGQQYSWVDLVAVDVQVPPLLPTGGVPEPGHGPVLTGPRVHDGVNQVIPRPLRQDGGRSGNGWLGQEMDALALLSSLSLQSKLSLRYSQQYHGPAPQPISRA